MEPPGHIELDLDAAPVAPRPRRAWIWVSAALLVVAAGVAVVIGHRANPVAPGVATAVYTPPELSVRFTGDWSATGPGTAGEGVLSLQFLNDSAVAVQISDPVPAMADGSGLAGVGLSAVEANPVPDGFGPPPIVVPSLGYSWLLVHYRLSCRVPAGSGRRTVPIMVSVSWTLSVGGRAIVAESTVPPGTLLPVSGESGCH